MVKSTRVDIDRIESRISFGGRLTKDRYCYLLVFKINKNLILNSYCKFLVYLSSNSPFHLKNKKNKGDEKTKHKNRNNLHKAMQSLKIINRFSLKESEKITVKSPLL